MYQLVARYLDDPVGSIAACRRAEAVDDSASSELQDAMVVVADMQAVWGTTEFAARRVDSTISSANVFSGAQTAALN
jgi:hypothetical protein